MSCLCWSSHGSFRILSIIRPWLHAPRVTNVRQSRKVGLVIVESYTALALFSHYFPINAFLMQSCLPLECPVAFAYSWGITLLLVHSLYWTTALWEKNREHTLAETPGAHLFETVSTRWRLIGENYTSGGNWTLDILVSMHIILFISAYKSLHEIYVFNITSSL